MAKGQQRKTKEAKKPKKQKQPVALAGGVVVQPRHQVVIFDI